MADFSSASTKRTSHWFCVILAFAMFALAGCNANQAISPCGRDPDCNPYDPTSYAQNQTGIRGGGH